jgi:hypothetical protein
MCPAFLGGFMTILIKRRNPLLTKKHTLIPLNKPLLTPLIEPTEVSPENSKRKIIKVRPKKEVKEVKSTFIKNVMAYWSQSNLKSLPKENTKSFVATAKAIEQINKGKFFINKEGCEEFQNSSFPEEQIYMAIDKFTLSANDSTYYPIDKSYLKSVTLFQFFYSTYSKYTKSYFLHYLKNEPIQRVEDKNEQLTNYLLGLYKTNVLNGTDVDISIKTKEKFIDGSAKLKNFFARNTNRVRMGIVVNELKLSKWLYESILFDIKDATKILPGFFCSAETFERRLPIYLINQSIFK